MEFYKRQVGLTGCIDATCCNCTISARSDSLSRKLLSDFPKSSSGVSQVTLILINGRKISEVYLARGEEIVKIDNKSISGIRDLGFSIFEIKDVISEI